METVQFVITNFLIINLSNLLNIIKQLVIKIIFFILSIDFLVYKPIKTPNLILKSCIFVENSIVFSIIN